jgi:hypothetical protein
MKRILPTLFLLWIASIGLSQQFKIVQDYMRIDAKADDPLYTTYAAAMSRSRLYGDKAYKLDYYSDCRTVSYSSDNAGEMFCIWKVDEVVIDRIA